MRAIILIVLIGYITHNLLGQRPIKLIQGLWILNNPTILYHDYVPDNCHLNFKLEVLRNKKIKFWFLVGRDSIGFLGKMKFIDNYAIRMYCRIREKVYLGKLENCVNVSMRLMTKGVINSIRSYQLKEDHLCFNCMTNNCDALIFRKQK